jgi:ribosomal protein S13
MARIAGVDLPKNERVEIGLTRILVSEISFTEDIVERISTQYKVKTYE